MEIKCTQDTGAIRTVGAVDTVRRLWLATTASSARLYTAGHNVTDGGINSDKERLGAISQFSTP